mgnify:CR=1 FL=1
MSTGWSLRRRLQRRVLVAVALGWLGSLGVGIYVIAHEMNELIDETMAAQAQMMAAVLPVGTAPDLRAVDGLRMRVIPPGSAIPALPTQALAQDSAAPSESWHVYRATNPRDGSVVELGQPTTARHKEIREAARALLLLMLPPLGIIVLATRRTVDGALVPALRFAERLRERRAGDSAPVPADDLPRELVPISEAINGYLSRIDALLESERAFAANAAHELRTPLAAAMAQAQLLAEGQGGAEAAKRLNTSLARLTNLVERLLELSRAEAGIGSTSGCDLVRIADLLVADMGASRILFDDSDFETLPAGVDADVAALILGNLLRNALHHGTGGVMLRLQPGPLVIVQNCTNDDAAFHHGRFEKGTTSSGAGLGLVIVNALAKANGIHMEFRMRDGLASIQVAFPPPTAARSNRLAQTHV